MEPALVIVVALVLLFLGAPIFLALGAGGLLGLYLARGSLGLFFAPTSLIGQLNSFELVALPLFILMGNFLSATPVGSLLFNAVRKWLGAVRGSLAICSVAASTLFGAVSGVSVAGVAAVGSVAVPEMLKHNYSRYLAAGSVVTAGALAMLIPPSVPFIIYGAIAGVSIAKLFIGGIVPGIVLAAALCLYIYVRARLHPEEAPVDRTPISWSERWNILGEIWHAMALVALVLGTIYTGIATPSEAAAFGAAGAFAIALWFGIRSPRAIAAIFTSSARISGAILLIMGCAKIFGDYLNLVRLPQSFASALVESGLPAPFILAGIMLLLIALGTLVDAISLVVVTTPIFVPVIVAIGYDPLWFGIIMVLNLEIAVVTPPVGLNLYTLRGVCPELRIEEIIRGSLPFVVIQLLVLALFVAFPALSLWLPALIAQ